MSRLPSRPDLRADDTPEDAVGGERSRRSARKDPQRDEGSASPFHQWDKLGIPAFVALLAPWYDQLVAARLIEEGFQPEAKILAMFVGAFLSFAAWWMLYHADRSRIVRVCLASVVLFIVAVVVCILFMTIVGVLWEPHSPLARGLVRLLWQMTYLVVFGAFGVAVSSGMLLATKHA